uniref:Uncharacterized protein n=1 Tax=Mycena chlorophos TaxID=658473 RepID=A0ABQ0KUS9_MYCCL|nr:predicted protein [Mycena chlorophos]
MGRRRVYANEEERCQAARASRSKYDQSSRGRQVRAEYQTRRAKTTRRALPDNDARRASKLKSQAKYRQSIRRGRQVPVSRRKTPRLALDKAPEVRADVAEESKFLLPTVHPLFQQALSGSLEGVEPYIYSPPYPTPPSHAHCPYNTEEELDACVHGSLAAEERAVVMIGELQRVGRGQALRRWTQMASNMMEAWLQIVAEEAAYWGKDARVVRMYGIHRRWIVRRFVRLRTLAFLDQD